MKGIAALSVAGLLATAGSAQAVLVISLGYNNLAASYSSGTSTYTVSSTSVSDGHADRTVPGTGSAAFNVGTLGGGTGSAVLSLSVGALVGPTRSGSGTMTITDADGDTIVATIGSGLFLSLDPNTFSFSGIISSVVITSNDGTFDGATSGSWSVAGLGSPLTGSVVHLSGLATGFFGTGDFAYAAGGGLTANIESPRVIPLPPAAFAGIGTLGGLAAIGVIRRRRLASN